jgi:hypothetical protein
MLAYYGGPSAIATIEWRIVSGGVMAHILVHQGKGARPIVELQVPAGTTLEVSRKLESLIYEKIAPDILRLGPCPNCRSGLDLFIKERFEDVIRVDLESFKVMR